MTARELNQLFDQARAGNPAAEKQFFDYLAERFRRFVCLRIWNPTDVDDVVQEAMMTICREYRNLVVTDSFTAWAYKVLDNRVLSFVQAQQTRMRRLDPDDSTIDGRPSPTFDPELRRRLTECVRKICAANLRYARILNLHSQGYETGEICARLELRENTLYSLLHRARALLRRCLETGDVR